MRELKKIVSVLGKHYKDLRALSLKEAYQVIKSYPKYNYILPLRLKQKEWEKMIDWTAISDKHNEWLIYFDCFIREGTVLKVRNYIFSAVEFAERQEFY